MLPIPGTYHPLKDSRLQKAFGKTVAGEIILFQGERTHFRIEFEKRTNGVQLHTLIIVCPHERVEIG